MVIAEIVPAFKGIADKLVKDAKPALDCPTVFPLLRMPSSSAFSQALSQGWSVCSSARCSA
jgi:ascorbate-specific PTS system EIIC-type component UlaA